MLLGEIISVYSEDNIETPWLKNYPLLGNGLINSVHRNGYA